MGFFRFEIDDFVVRLPGMTVVVVVMMVMLKARAKGRMARPLSPCA